MMRLFCVLSIVVFASAVVSGCDSVKEMSDIVTPDHVLSFARLREQFRDPPVRFSSAPLWVWNDDVTEETIDNQLSDMLEGGIRSVFIHPRPGLVTPYLSDSWHSLCRYTVDRAKELGMEVWLYDENSYPSGFAGGHVPAEMPESYNQGQGLVYSRADRLSLEPDKQYAVVLKREGDNFVDITDRLDGETGKTGDYRLFELAFYRKLPWFGGYTYVDLLHEGVTEKFIEVTMRGYEKAIGDEFGKTVPGIFTDEPNIAPPVGGSIRWTPSLFAAFRERWGYDLVTTLPSLFENIGEWKRVRHDYYALLLDMFIERWCKPWNRYCEEHDLLWTGHYWEHGWPSPHHGGDNMAMYAWHHVPAIDILMNEYNEGTRAQFGNVRSVKELASAANQMGRTRTLSETYGAGGWDLRFEDMKRIGDWEYALGVSFLNQHLSYITIMGARKRDHPQSFSYHEPWWKHYKTLGDYFARLSLALSAGRQENGVLVMEPTSTAWMHYSPANTDTLTGAVGNAFQNFVLDLERYQIEYDIGCENIIRDNGSASGGKFIVGERSYDCVVLPPGLGNLEGPTVKLIEQYVEQGGTVLSFVGVPGFVDGRESDALDGAAANAERWIEARSITDNKALTPLKSSDFTVQSPENITGKLFHHRRRLDDGELVFLVNTSLDENSIGSLAIQGETAVELDAQTGDIRPYPADAANGEVTISFDIPPAGSLLLYAGKSSGRPSGELPEKRQSLPLAGDVIPSSSELVVRGKTNVLTLDYCDVRYAGKEEKDVYFYAASDRIYRQYGFEGDPWSMAVQFKSNILDRNDFPADSGFEADFRFEVGEGVDTSSFRAVVERPELWRVSVNGKTVGPVHGEWQIDRCFGVYDISPHVTPGRNVLTLAASPMTVHSELEPVYITGGFFLEAVRKGWKIVADTSASPFDAWCRQGSPFYSDMVSYSRKYTIPANEGRYAVRLGDWYGSIAEVRVNGKSAGIIGWRPFEREITALVREGSNDIEVIVYGTLKNLLGPHHNNPPLGRAWPRMFHDAPEHQPPGAEYDVVGYGLFEKFSVVAFE